jgi:hypothetical protein
MRLVSLRAGAFRTSGCPRQIPNENVGLAPGTNTPTDERRCGAAVRIMESQRARKVFRLFMNDLPHSRVLCLALSLVGCTTPHPQRSHRL